VNWNISFTKYDRALAAYYKEKNPLFLKDVAVAKQILQDEKSLQEIVQLVGKDSLSEDQKTTLELARLIREDFLSQNAFSEFDYTCPLEKCSGMLRCLVTFYERAIQAVRQQDRPSTWGKIRYGTLLQNIYVQLTRMKFVPPNQTDEQLKTYFTTFQKEIQETFKKFRES